MVKTREMLPSLHVNIEPSTKLQFLCLVQQALGSSRIIFKEGSTPQQVRAAFWVSLFRDFEANHAQGEVAGELLGPQPAVFEAAEAGLHVADAHEPYWVAGACDAQQAMAEHALEKLEVRLRLLQNAHDAV